MLLRARSILNHHVDAGAPRDGGGNGNARAPLDAHAILDGGGKCNATRSRPQSIPDATFHSFAHGEFPSS